MDPSPLHLQNSHLQQLATLASRCTECTLNSREEFPFAVFGIGDMNPELGIIGEGPGEKEQEEGRPFIGRAGQLLQTLTHKLGYQGTRRLYITNIVKHRPPNNRNPLAPERNLCVEKFLKAELEIVNPKVIVCLGRVATESLLTADGQPIPKGSLRGYRFLYRGRKAISTWHPAYCLRQPERTFELEEDLCFARDTARSDHGPSTMSGY